MKTKWFILYEKDKNEWCIIDKQGDGSLVKGKETKREGGSGEEEKELDV